MRSNRPVKPALLLKIQIDMNFWSWGKKPAKFHGLVNQGATCYLNSVLQVLFMTEDFRERVKSHTTDNASSERIDSELSDLFNDLEKDEAYTYKITKRLKIKNVYEQRDAAEHYEKILRLASPGASEIFHGSLVNRSTCKECGDRTESEAGFWHLPLPLVDSNKDYSVEKGIKDFFRPSLISGEDKMYCEKCDEKCDAVLDCEVKHYPEVLVLLLKHFEFDYSYMTYIKINCAVDVPHTIHIPQNQSYELYAVVEHFGELRCGHYISRIKSKDDDKWYSFNDTEVQSIDLPKMEKSRSAYLLFYRKQKAPVPDVMNQTSVPPLTDTTIKTEDTSDTSGEEEKDTPESVRPTQKRAKSSDERGSAEDAQVKKQKQELSDQVVPQAATGEEYEEGNTDRNIDNDIQDLGYSVGGLAQQTHNPNVSIQDDSGRANSDKNQSPPKGDDSIVKTQNNEGNSSTVTTKEPSELVTRGEKVQSVSKLFLGQKYDSQNLDTEAQNLAENLRSDNAIPRTDWDCKDCVRCDRSYNNQPSPCRSGAHVNSESVDMKHKLGVEHVNIEGSHARVRGNKKTHDPDVEMQDYSNQERTNSDWNQPRQSSSDIDDSIVKTQCNECNITSMRNKEPSEHVTRGGKVQSVSKQFPGPEYDGDLLGTQTNTGAHKLPETFSKGDSGNCKDYVSQDRRWKNQHSGVPVISESIDVNHVPGVKHVNIGGVELEGVRGSLEKTAPQSELSSGYDWGQVKKQDIKTCIQESQSDIGAHTLNSEMGHRKDYEVVGESDCNGDFCIDTSHRNYLEGNSNNYDPCLGLSGVHKSKQQLRAMEIEKMDVPGGDHVNMGNEDQAGVRDSLEKTLQPKYSTEDDQVEKYKESYSQQNQSDIVANVLGETGQISSYDPVAIGRISKDGWTKRYDNCMSDQGLTSLPLNALSQPSLTKQTCVMGVCNNIEDVIQGRKKQDECQTGTQAFFDKNEPSLVLSGVPITKNDLLKECFRTIKIEKNGVPGGEHVNIGNEEQAGLRDSLEKTMKPKDCTEEKQDEIIIKSCSQQNQSEISDSLQLYEGQRSSYGPLRNDDEEGCASRYGHCTSHPALTNVPLNTSRQSTERISQDKTDINRNDEERTLDMQTQMKTNVSHYRHIETHKVWGQPNTGEHGFVENRRRYDYGTVPGARGHQNIVRGFQRHLRNNDRSDPGLNDVAFNRQCFVRQQDDVYHGKYRNIAETCPLDRTGRHSLKYDHGEQDRGNTMSEENAKMMPMGFEHSFYVSYQKTTPKYPSQDDQLVKFGTQVGPNPYYMGNKGQKKNEIKMHNQNSQKPMSKQSYEEKQKSWERCVVPREHIDNAQQFTEIPQQKGPGSGQTGEIGKSQRNQRMHENSEGGTSERNEQIYKSTPKKCTEQNVKSHNQSRGDYTAGNMIEEQKREEGKKQKGSDSRQSSKGCSGQVELDTHSVNEELEHLKQDPSVFETSVKEKKRRKCKWCCLLPCMPMTQCIRSKHKKCPK